MARNIRHYLDPEEQGRLMLLEQEFGPPAPPPSAHPNLGVAPVPRLPIDMTTPRRTDGDYSGFHDPYQDQEPTAEELAADEDHEQIAPASGERVQAAGPLDVLLEKAANPAEVAAQRYAGEQKLAAPRAVDDKATSVADEQKGVPAAKLALDVDTGDEVGWADELLQSVRTSVINKPEASTTPLYKTAETLATQALQPTEGFSKEKQSRLALEAYGEDTPPSSRWEDEFLKERGDSRLTDAQIRRRAAAIGFVSAATTDDHEAGARWADQQRRSNQDFAEGRTRARDRDKLETRIPRGLASAIAATGVPPEEAAKLTYGDPLVKAFSSGMYSQGGRAEGQALGWQKAQLHEAIKLIDSGDNDSLQRGLAMLRTMGQLGVASLYANKGKPEPVDPNDPNAIAPPTQRERAINAMSRRMRVDAATAERYLNRDYGELPPDQQRLAENARVDIAQMVNDEKAERAVNVDVGKVETSREAKVKFGVEQSVEKAKADPQYRTKFKTDWTVARDNFAVAWEGWNDLSQDGKDALAKWAAGGWTGKIRSFLMQPGDQERVAAIQGVINALVKDRSGSAVTGSEWERIATEIGIVYDDWNPWNSPTAIENFLKRTGNKLRVHRQVFDDEIGWETPDVR